MFLDILSSELLKGPRYELLGLVPRDIICFSADRQDRRLGLRFVSVKYYVVNTLIC